MHVCEKEKEKDIVPTSLTSLCWNTSDLVCQVQSFSQYFIYIKTLVQ